MRFLADESCDFAVVRALRNASHDVATVRDLAPGAPDEEVVRITQAQERILLTEDRDFGRLVFASTAKSPGILYLRFPASARHAMVKTVLSLVDRKDFSFDRHFVVVQPGRIRVMER